MELKEYFASAKGLGVLATADDQGIVDAAVYAKPHFPEEGSIAFIMADRLTHRNLLSNGHAPLPHRRAAGLAAARRHRAGGEGPGRPR